MSWPFTWIPLPELPGSGAEGSELIHCCGNRRKAEGLKGFEHHPFEIGDGSNASCDMGAELLTGVLIHEAGDVVNQGVVERWVPVIGRERLNGTRLHHERSNSRGDALLEVEQFGGGVGHDPRQPNPAARYVVGLEGLQCDAAEIGIGKDLTDSGKDLLESVRADKALHQGDVGTMLCVQGKSLGEDRKQASVAGLGKAKHGGVWLQQDVDRRDRVLQDRLELGAHHPKGHRPSLKRCCGYISPISSLLHGSAKPQQCSCPDQQR